MSGICPCIRLVFVNKSWDGMNVVFINIFSIFLLIKIDKLNISMKEIVHIDLIKDFLTVLTVVTIKEVDFILFYRRDNGFATFCLVSVIDDKTCKE